MEGPIAVKNSLNFIQASIDVACGQFPRYGEDGCIFIEHDVRGGGQTGDDRTKYSCSAFPMNCSKLFELLALNASEISACLKQQIDEVKAMPSEPLR